MRWDIKKGEQFVARNKQYVTKEELIEAAKEYYDLGWWISVFGDDTSLISGWESHRPGLDRISSVIDIEKKYDKISIALSQSRLWSVPVTDAEEINSTDKRGKESPLGIEWNDAWRGHGTWDISNWWKVQPTPTWQDETGVYRLFMAPFDNGEATWTKSLPPSRGGFWLPGYSPSDVDPATLPYEWVIKYLEKMRTDANYTKWSIKEKEEHLGIVNTIIENAKNSGYTLRM